MKIFAHNSIADYSLIIDTDNMNDIPAKLKDNGFLENEDDLVDWDFYEVKSRFVLKPTISYFAEQKAVF